MLYHALYYGVCAALNIPPIELKYKDHLPYHLDVKYSTEIYAIPEQSPILCIVSELYCLHYFSQMKRGLWTFMETS